jgi:hypothetical protein
MRRVLLPLLLLAIACKGSSALSPFDEADSMTRKLGRARELYRKAAISDPDPKRRDRAHIRAARIDWHVFQDATSARTTLAKVQDAESALERARMEIHLTHDFKAARAAADRAMQVATKQADNVDAHLLHATATIEEARQARLAGRCPKDVDALRSAMVELRGVIDTIGPQVDPSRLLLNAALMSGDDATALQAWRWYYADVPSAVPASIPARPELGYALAKSKLFEEAELVLRDPCAPAEADAATRDLLTYATSLRRVRTLADEHHRAIARGTNDDDKMRKAIEKEAEALWNALSWNGARPKFSLEAAAKEFDRRFGAVVTLGDVDGAANVVVGHRVVDEKRQVEQYGHRAAIRFVQLDGMYAIGYLGWLTRGQTGTGGWNGDDDIVQIRPMYANGPIRRWRRITDSELRAKQEEEIADETRRDLERGKNGRLEYFRGLDLRLQRQFADGLRDSLAATGLSGDALRDAFIKRAREIEFASSIWAHEGRHAIDKQVFKIDNDTELEYRAKLSEVAFAPAPRAGLSAILSILGGSGAHAKANERVLKGVEKWMRANAGAIARIDQTRPLLPQLDLLTDDQLREAFRSLDPLAK